MMNEREGTEATGGLCNPVSVARSYSQFYNVPDVALGLRKGLYSLSQSSMAKGNP
jgi:hypothetical protein